MCVHISSDKCEEICDYNIIGRDMKRANGTSLARIQDKLPIVLTTMQPVMMTAA